MHHLLHLECGRPGGWCTWLEHLAYLGLLQAQSQLVAARLQSEQGAEAVQAVKHLVQQEWQQLKKLRQRYMQPARQVCAGASNCHTCGTAAPASTCKCLCHAAGEQSATALHCQKYPATSIWTSEKEAGVHCMTSLYSPSWHLLTLIGLLKGVCSEQQ